MPIKKPKAEKLPSPFQDLEKSGDDSQRMRAIRMKQELDTAGGFSWNAPRQSLIRRLLAWPRQRLAFALLAAGMGAGLIGAFALVADTGYVPPPTIIYIESWGADRTREDAAADQKEAMDKLRAEVARNRAALAAAEARARALEAEQAAAARAGT